MSDLVPISKEALTTAQYSKLAGVPPEIEWIVNITNPKTRRAYKVDVAEFPGFIGLHQLTQLCTVRARMSSLGAKPWSRAAWSLPVSGASSRIVITFRLAL